MKEAALRYSQSKINSLQWPIKQFYILFSTPCSGLAKNHGMYYPVYETVHVYKRYLAVSEKKFPMLFFSKYVTDCRLHVTIVKMFVLESTAIVRVQAFYCNHILGLFPICIQLFIVTKFWDYSLYSAFTVIIFWDYSLSIFNFLM